MRPAHTRGTAVDARVKKRNGRTCTDVFLASVYLLYYCVIICVCVCMNGP